MGNKGGKQLDLFSWQPAKELPKMKEGEPDPFDELKDWERPDWAKRIADDEIPF